MVPMLLKGCTWCRFLEVPWGQIFSLIFFGKVFDEFFWQFFWQIFFYEFLWQIFIKYFLWRQIFWQIIHYLLSIASFRIGVPSILFFNIFFGIKLGFLGLHTFSNVNALHKRSPIAGLNIWLGYPPSFDVDKTTIVPI